MLPSRISRSRNVDQVADRIHFERKCPSAGLDHQDPFAGIPIGDGDTEFSGRMDDGDVGAAQCHGAADGRPGGFARMSFAARIARTRPEFDREIPPSDLEGRIPASPAFRPTSRERCGSGPHAIYRQGEGETVAGLFRIASGGEFRPARMPRREHGGANTESDGAPSRGRHPRRGASHVPPSSKAGCCGNTNVPGRP